MVNHRVEPHHSLAIVVGFFFVFSHIAGRSPVVIFLGLVFHTLSATVLTSGNNNTPLRRG
jgi:hypothetical protein